MNKAEAELRKVKDNASNILNNAKIEINKNKARVEFSKTVKEVTEGIDNIIDIKIDGSDVVAEEYFEQMGKVEDMGIKVNLDTLNEDDDFDKFIKGE